MFLSTVLGASRGMKTERSSGHSQEKFIKDIEMRKSDCPERLVPSRNS